MTEQPASAREIAGLLGKATERIQDAKVDQSREWRFAAAWDAARLLCTVVLRAAGYRAVGRVGQHEVVVEALPLIMGAAQINRSHYYNKCRRRRGDVVYDAIPTATEREVEELVDDLGQFNRQVIGWLRQDHPELMKA